MDFNHLYARQQVSLIMAENEASRALAKGSAALIAGELFDRGLVPA